MTASHNRRIDLRQAKSKPIALAAGLCVLMLALVCGLAVAQNSPEASVSSGSLPGGAVVQLVAIGPGEQGQNKECSATGFLVDEEGYILTNAHVVEDARRCLRGSPGAKILAKLASPGKKAAEAISCDLIATDATHDLALLKTEHALPAELAAAKTYAVLSPRELLAGTRVAVIGHPGFSWETVEQEGEVVWRGNQPLNKPSQELSEVFVMNIHLRPGNSGSPVCIDGGGVVGVVVEGDLNVARSTAVSVSYGIRLLDSQHVHWHAIGK